MTAMCVAIKDCLFKSFQELKQEFALINHDHYWYFQLRDLCNKEMKDRIDLINNGIVKTLIWVYTGKNYRIISTLYKYLIEKGGHMTLNVKVKWEKELGIAFLDNEFTIWRTQHSSTSSRISREHCWKNKFDFSILQKSLVNSNPESFHVGETVTLSMLITYMFSGFVPK